MEMTIEDCIDELQKLKLPISKHDLSFHFVEHTRNKTVDTAIDTMRKYQLLQADYENRLKADMVAMLTELQLEIEEKFNDRPFSYNHHQRTEFYRDIDEIIQEKINSLKED